jgi:hypothetical protein
MATSTTAPPARSTRALKIGFGIAGALFSVSALPSLGFLIATIAPDDVQAPELMLAVFASMLLTLVPPLAGFLAAVLSTDPRTPKGRRQGRAVAVVSAALVLAGAVALVISSTLGALPGGVTAGVAGGSIAVTAGSLLVGSVIRQRDAARPRTPWSPHGLEATTTHKNVRRVVWTFTITLLVTAAALVVLGLVSREESSFILPGALLAVSIASISASAACLVVAFPLFFRAREIFDGDTALQRRVGKVVLGRQTLRRNSSSVAHDEQADPNSVEQTAAAKYAAVMDVLLPLQLAQSGLVLVAVLFGQLAFLATTNNDLDTLNLSVIAFVLVTGGAIAPFSLRQIRRVRQYRNDHPLESLPT